MTSQGWILEGGGKRTRNQTLVTSWSIQYFLILLHQRLPCDNFFFFFCFFTPTSNPKKIKSINRSRSAMMVTLPFEISKWEKSLSLKESEMDLMSWISPPLQFWFEAFLTASRLKLSDQILMFRTPTSLHTWFSLVNWRSKQRFMLRIHTHIFKSLHTNSFSLSASRELKSRCWYQGF